MRLSPISIKNQDFGKKMRGFDPEDVIAFLEKVADEFEDLIKENESLKKLLDSAEEKLSEFRRIEKNLQETLLKAQEASTKSIESTKKQTGLMVKEAEIKASQILDKAKESANEIRNSIIQLREERDTIIARLRAIVETQANLLEMKVADTENEKVISKKIEQAKKVDIDINSIVDRIS